MTKYIAPTEEVSFVLKHLANIGDLQKLPGYEEATPDLVAAILDEAGKFAQDVLAPLNWEGDQHGVTLEQGGVKAAPGFADAYQQYFESGWLGLAQPPQFGGQGLPFTLHLAASEFWNSANTSFALCPMLSASGIDALLAHGSKELQNTYLEKLISGEWTGTMLLTEPQAGSDLAALSSKAKKNGDHYLIKGSKIFITWGDHDMTDNVVQFVLARLPGAPEGVKGISLFLVPKYLVNKDGTLGELNDSKPVSVEHKLGIHASPTCVMSFGDNGGAVGYLIGEENQGLKCMFTMMIHARLEVGLEGVAISERSYQGAVDYALNRKQGNKRDRADKVAIVEHADVRRMLMLMRALTQASRALCYIAAANYDQSKANPDPTIKKASRARLDLLTPIVKAWSTEIAQEVTGLGIQTLGGMGFIEESGMAQHYRDARITTIYEGTTGIQSNDLIGRKLIRDKGEQMTLLVKDMASIAIQLGNTNETRGIAQSLENGISQLNSATQFILDNWQSSEDFCGSVSVNYLMLCGTVMGAWQMARATHAAINDKRVSDRFRDDKIATTRFYMQHVLPRAYAYQQAVEFGHDSVMSIPSKQL